MFKKPDSGLFMVFGLFSAMKACTMSISCHAELNQLVLHAFPRITTLTPKAEPGFLNTWDGLKFVRKSDLGLCYVVTSVLNGTYART